MISIPGKSNGHGESNRKDVVFLLGSSGKCKFGWKSVEKMILGAIILVDGDKKEDGTSVFSMF